MALQYVLDSLDGVDEGLKDHYAQGDDGKFTLSLEGAPKQDAGLAAKYEQAAKRTVELRKEREALVSERDALRAAAAEAADRGKSEMEKLTEQVAALTRAKEEADRRAAELRFSDAVRTAASKAGVHDAAHVDVLGRARAAGLKMNGNGVEGVDEFFAGLRKGAPFLFNGSSGDAAKEDRAKAGGAGQPTPEQWADPVWAAANREAIISGRLKPA